MQTHHDSVLGGAQLRAEGREGVYLVGERSSPEDEDLAMGGGDDPRFKEFTQQDGTWRANCPQSLKLLLLTPNDPDSRSLPNKVESD